MLLPSVVQHAPPPCAPSVLPVPAPRVFAPRAQNLQMNMPMPAEKQQQHQQHQPLNNMNSFEPNNSQSAASKMASFLSMRIRAGQHLSSGVPPPPPSTSKPGGLGGVNLGVGVFSASVSTTNSNGVCGSSSDGGRSENKVSHADCMSSGCMDAFEWQPCAFHWPDASGETESQRVQREWAQAQASLNNGVPHQISTQQQQAFPPLDVPRPPLPTAFEVLTAGGRV